MPVKGIGQTVRRGGMFHNQKNGVLLIEGEVFIFSQLHIFGHIRTYAPVLCKSFTKS